MKQILLAVALMLAASSASAEIHRSQSAVRSFKKSHPCPATNKPYGKCPGYVVDHIIPLACKGHDRPSNMQWQTVEDARAKDKWERKGCQK